MAAFRFDLNESPEENIASFFAHLAAHDNEMATILKANLSLIHPLPEYPPQRSAARKSFSAVVLSALKALEETKENKGQ